VRPVPFHELRAFCRADGWQRKADAPGQVVRKHEVWTKQLSDGRVLRVVVSKGSGEYSPPLAARILKHELEVTQEQFRRAVRDGVPPSRAVAGPAPPAGVRLPYSLVRALLTAGHSSEEIAGLSLEQARRIVERG
jgi:hypothetical protein